MPDKFHSLWRDPEDGQFYIAPDEDVAREWAKWEFERVTDRSVIAKAAKIARAPNARRNYSAVIIGIALAVFGLVIWWAMR